MRDFKYFIYSRIVSVKSVLETQKPYGILEGELIARLAFLFL